MRELKKSFWDFIAIGGSTVLAIPLMLVSEYIQAKYLGPANYGKVALILSAISLLHIFGLNWLIILVMRYGKEEFIKEGHLRKTTTNFLLTTFVCFLIVTYIFYLFRNEIFNLLEIKHASSFWVIIFGLVLVTIKRFIFEVLKVIRQLKLQSFLLRLAPKILVVTGILFCLFILLKINVIYIIAIFLLSDAIITTIALFTIRLKYIFPLQFDSILLKRMIIFSLPLLFSSWSTYIINWIDIYVIKFYMTMTDVGIYQAAYKIYNTLNSFFIAGLVTITTPILMVFKTENQINKIKNLYLERLLPQVSFISMGIIAIIILFSDFGFKMIYGEEFDSAIIPFKILIASQNIAILNAMLSGIRISFDMTKLMLYLGVLMGTVNIIGDVILVQIFGINGPAIVSFSVFSLTSLIWVLIINKKFEINRMLALLFPLLTSFIMIINVLSISFISRLAITVVILISGYLLARQFNLFNTRDINLLNNIVIPKPIKKLYIEFIHRMEKS